MLEQVRERGPVAARDVLAHERPERTGPWWDWSDVKRAFRVCEGLETGMIGLNQGLVSNPAAPFGGVKASGFGREGGAEGIEEYLETKYVAIALD